MRKSLVLTLIVLLILAASAARMIFLPMAAAAGHPTDANRVRHRHPHPAQSAFLFDRKLGEIRGVAMSLSPSHALTDTLTYLPLVLKRWPPIPDIPRLHEIDNDDGDDSYRVSWDLAFLADTYELQEDDNSAFSSPVQRYAGTSTTYRVTGRSVGTYYYRVRACNSYGCSRWSEPPRQVKVLPPSCLLRLENDTGGNLCYEVEGTGIGERCFSSGTHTYGTFPVGTYRYCARARCGKICESEYFPATTVTQRFWCGYTTIGDERFQFLERVE